MRRLLTVVPAVAVVSALVVPTASAVPRSAPPPTAPPDDARTTQVTLLTGDQVRVTRLPDGKSTVDVTPAERDGNPPSFLTIERDGDLHVIPEDVQPLVPTRLDPALFNVTELVEQGYDDASHDSLPMIVSYRDGPRPKVPAAEVTHQLESIDSSGVSLGKDRAAEFGTALTTLAGATERGRSTRSAGPLARVEKIWLDTKLEGTLDESASQVGAPAAWDAGLDGSGVTVAVLDSGIDTTHPDFAGRVVGERNFTDNPTPADGLGHGTHVASIIGGSGAASDGAYRGMAPGVDLLNGKVLNDFNQGYTSGIIDGMEWAAEQGADVINMSLGAVGPNFQVVSDSADALTAQHDTLFVVAAGNDACDACLGHPASAKSAVTVGAVDKSDVLADFSSRGPLPDSYTIKPDVTAPGVTIGAARAEGTALCENACTQPGDGPIDDNYTSATGTSMASPHVAGVAALLLQADPSLSPDELKTRLMNTAEPHADFTVYAQGAGRVDIERALATPVQASPGSVNFGYHPWSPEGSEPESQNVTYRNLTGDDVVLTLSVESAAPAGALTTSAPTVTVPAEGTAAVEVVLDTTRVEPGLYGGYLLAEAADGTSVRTPVGFYQQRELVELRLRGIARDGRPASTSVSILDVDNGTVNASRYLSDNASTTCSEAAYDSSSCILVPPGTYSVLALVDTLPAYERPAAPLNRSLVGDPEIEIAEGAGTVDVVLDARKATEVLVDTPAHETKRNLGAAVQIEVRRAPAQGSAVELGRFMWPGATLEERLFMQPMDEVSTGELAAYTRWRLEAPRITLGVTAPQEIELEPRYYASNRLSDFSSQFPMLDGDLDTQIVDAGLGSQEDVASADLDGNVALIRRSDAIPVARQSNNAAEAGAKLVVVYNDAPGPNSDPGSPVELLRVPTTWISHEEGEAVRALLADGPVRVGANGKPASPHAYKLVLTEHGSIPADLRYVAKPDQLATIESPVHSQLSDELSVHEHWFPYQRWENSAYSPGAVIRGGPRTPVTYVTPGPSVEWSRRMENPEQVFAPKFGPYEPRVTIDLDGGRRSYDAGRRYRHSWYEQPLAPGPSPVLPPTRTGDSVWLYMDMLDGAGNYGPITSDEFEHGLDTSLRVYRGDELVMETPFQPDIPFEAEPEPTRYRAVYDITNGATWAKLSTRTHSEWTFTSRRPADGERRVEQLLRVDYDFDVDLRNRAPHPRDRKGPHQIAMSFTHPDGAEQIPVDEVTLAVSYDDGKTWDEVRKVRKGRDDRYVATLSNRHPHGGFLSLKLSAADERGNTMKQEIIRAYALPRR